MGIQSSSVEGLTELINATRRIADQAIPALDIASKEGATEVLDKAKTLVPVSKLDKPHLRDLLKVAKMATSRNKYLVGYKVTFGKGGAYGVPLELGHNIVVRGQTLGHVRARPFLRPAADETRKDFTDLVVQTMNTELDKWGDKR